MINLLINITIVTLFFLFPLFFLPITVDQYEYNKMALLVVTSTVLLLLFCLKVVSQRRLVLTGGSFGGLFLLLTLAVIISTLFQSPNLILVLTTPLSITTLIAGFLLYFVLVNIIGNEEKERLINILIFTATIVSLYTILLYLGIFPQNPFTPAGGLLATTTFLTTVCIYLVSRLITTIIKGNTEIDVNLLSSKAFLINFFSLLLVGIASFLLIIHMATDQKPLVLPLSFGWQIFLEVLKNARTLLLGVGPTNFIAAFTLARPLGLNNTPLWNVLFTSSSSFLLTLATEIGIIAAFAYLAIFLKAIKLLRSINHPFDYAQGKQPSTYNHLPYTVTLIFALFLQIILPGNMILFILTVILLAFASEKKKPLVIDIAKLKYLTYVILLPSIVLLFGVVFWGGRVYLAEVSFKQSRDALARNQGADAYRHQLRALGLNSYLDRYHVTFSQTSLALANVLASKAELTNEDKQNIPKLVQQAIDEARKAVALGRTNVINWNHLANTYTSLVNFANGADEWAIKSYQQILFLDPVNPSSYFSFGRFYLNLKKYKEAENLFRQTISLKRDFANAHYNLAWALGGQERHQEAYQELQITVSLLPVGSEDVKRVESEIADLAKLLPPAEATTSGLPQIAPSQPQTLETAPTTAPDFSNIPTLLPTIELPESPIAPQ